MSVYVVNVAEPYGGNKALKEIAQRFKGDLFHCERNCGSFMVHAQDNVTPDQQRNEIRSYFAAQAISVIEKPNESGHVIFEVNITRPENQYAASKFAPEL